MCRVRPCRCVGAGLIDLPRSVLRGFELQAHD
jgi:hypothetical protein